MRGREADLFDAFECRERLSEPQLWSPDRPSLYGLRVEVRRGQITHDAVDSYFGLREVAVREGKIWLNGEPCYQRLALDQGYFPGGIYTPETDEAIRRDIELAKACGFNGVRKHQKVEDPRFYYWADRLGLLVWGEMANTFEFSDAACARLEREWREVVRRDRNHPCIIVWTPINESWGVPQVGSDSEQQAFVERIVDLTRSEDPTRPVCPPASCPWATTRSAPDWAMRLAFLLLPAMPRTFIPTAWAFSAMKPGFPRPAQKSGTPSSMQTWMEACGREVVDATRTVASGSGSPISSLTFITHS